MGVGVKTSADLFAILAKSLSDIEVRDREPGEAVLELLRRHEVAVAALDERTKPIQEKLARQIQSMPFVTAPTERFDEWYVRHYGDIAIATTERERMRSAWYSSALAMREKIARLFDGKLADLNPSDVAKRIRESAP